MNLMKEAHRMTKEIKREYPEVDYKFQLGLCLSYLSKKEGNNMVELKGSEKQVKWANDIRRVVIRGAKAVVADKKEVHEARGKKATLRRLEEAQKMLKILETEESAEYFIDNFAYILRNIKKYELTAQMREVSLDLVIGYEVKSVLEV